MSMTARRNHRLLRLIQVLGLMVAAFAILIVWHTLTILLWAVAVLVTCVPGWFRTTTVALLWVGMVLTALLPVDVSFQNRPGPPHFARYVMGLPGREAIAASKRGEVVLGGCVATGFEPRWVWVW